MRKAVMISSVVLLLLGLTGCWPNQPPVAIFAVDKNVGTAPLTVVFNATASYDPDGRIESYYWEFGDGTTGQGMIVAHTYTSPGVYFPILRVRDNRGAEDTTTGRITVTRANRPPVAYYQAYWYNREELTIILDPTASYDPDGYIVEYRWNIAGRVFVYTRPYRLKVQFCCPGNYTIALTVKDNDGATSTYRRTWYISPSAQTLQTTEENGLNDVEIEVQLMEGENAEN